MNVETRLKRVRDERTKITLINALLPLPPSLPSFPLLSLLLPSSSANPHEEARKKLRATRGVAMEVDAHEGHEATWPI